MAADDTVFALASGAGRAAIAVVRVSGPDCGRVVGRICSLPPPRSTRVRTLRNSAGETLDRAIVLWFPGPGSYTGEDSAELHLHGGQAVLEGVTQALMENGARPAEPGEFTRRAFMAGKMNLLEAEAVADLVEAETPEQRAHALRQLSGEQTHLLHDWVSRLSRCLALQEALIDFSEEDLPDIEAEMLDDLRGLHDELRRHVAMTDAGERLRRGLVFVITGPPNVGKSSLLNVLAGRDASIVSAMPGTTRDLVTVDVILAGIPVTFVDTAGIRETTDEVEGEGVRRARNEVARSDLVMEVVDASTLGNVPPCQDGIFIANKVDLAPAPPGFLGVSVSTGAGLDRLISELTVNARRLIGAGGSATFNRARHRAALQGADSAVAAALACLNAEMRAEELRLAMQSLGRMIGQVDTDDILDMVFSSFCIGK